MLIQGSCHCGNFRYRATTRTPYPYMRCYCTICRKTAGGGGFGINIMADASSLTLKGDQSPPFFQARIYDAPGGPPEGRVSPARRHLCHRCGTFLYVADTRWPDAIYPFASSVDTDLPTPPETVHIMLDFKSPWVDVPTGPGNLHFPRYPEESIVDWHQRHGLLSSGNG